MIAPDIINNITRYKYHNMLLLTMYNNVIYRVYLILFDILCIVHDIINNDRVYFDKLCAQ